MANAGYWCPGGEHTRLMIIKQARDLILALEKFNYHHHFRQKIDIYE